MHDTLHVSVVGHFTMTMTFVAMCMTMTPMRVTMTATMRVTMTAAMRVTVATATTVGMVMLECTDANQVD